MVAIGVRHGWLPLELATSLGACPFGMATMHSQLADRGALLSVDNLNN